MKRSCVLMLFLAFFVAAGTYAQNQATISVSQIVVCTSVANKLPAGVDTVFSADVKQLSCYTTIASQEEQSEISHVWFYQDKQMTKIDLKVKGKAFHTWSTKNMNAKWKGDWRVEVQDAAGKVLAKVSFTVR